MPRRPTPTGTHGAVNTRALVDGTWYPKEKVPAGVKPTLWSASTRFADADGVNRPVKRHGASETKAKAALETACAERIGSNASALAPDTRFHEIAALWLKRVKVNEKGTTYDTYRRWLNGRIVPALGEVRLRELDVARLQDYFDLLAATRLPTGQPLSANSRRQVKNVIRLVLAYAVRRKILKTNPMNDLEKIKGGTRKKPRAYDKAQAADFLARVDSDKLAVRGQLNCLVRFMFNTGCRLGEAIAVRWQELNLTDEMVKVWDPVAGEMEIPPHSAWISGNIVRVTGEGLLRHEGKTFDSQGIVGLPPSVEMMLIVMRPINATDREPVFPNKHGGWRDPNNLQTSIKRLCARIEVEDFTTHLARKTYGTALDSARQSGRQIADALRKASVKDTQETYMGRGLVNKEAAAIVDDFFRPVER